MMDIRTRHTLYHTSSVYHAPTSRMAEVPRLSKAAPEAESALYHWPCCCSSVDSIHRAAAYHEHMKMLKDTAICWN